MQKYLKNTLHCILLRIYDDYDDDDYDNNNNNNNNSIKRWELDFPYGPLCSTVCEVGSLTIMG